MKSLNIIRIPLLIVGLFISSQLMSKEEKSIMNESHNKNYLTENSDTTLVFTAHIGEYPKYNGIKNVLDTIEVSVNSILQGKSPYNCFYKRNGMVQESYSIIDDIFTYTIKLSKCEEEERYSKFAIVGSFYLADTLILSYNDEVPSNSHSSNHWLLMDKSNSWESIGISRFASHDISTADNHKYILRRNQSIDLKNSTDNIISSQHDVFTVGHLFFSCSSIFGKINNRVLLGRDLIDNKLPKVKYLYSMVSQDQSIKSSYSNNNRIDTKKNSTVQKNNLTSNQFTKSLASNSGNLGPKIPESPFYKYLNDGDRKLLIKILGNEINTDPKGNGHSSFTKCGQKSGWCRWCRKTSRFVTYFNTVSYLIRGANDDVMLYPFFMADVSKRTQLIKEIKQYINMIRIGQYYVCETNLSEMFCSPKCKFEHNQSR